MTNPVPFDSVETAIQAITAGGLVIVTDDEGRENEGDLVMAAEKAAANRDTSARLRRAHLDQAASLRRARDPGYRAKVWDHLREAEALGPGESDGGELLELARSCLGDPIGLDPIDGSSIDAAFSGRTQSDGRTTCVRNSASTTTSAWASPCS